MGTVEKDIKLTLEETLAGAEICFDGLSPNYCAKCPLLKYDQKKKPGVFCGDILTKNILRHLKEYIEFSKTIDKVAECFRWNEEEE